MSDEQPRLDWDQYFMQICRVVARRSTCTRAAVGAVIVKDRMILASGYNGAPAGMPHCSEVGCLIVESTDPAGESEENCFRTIHAEINAIAQAARSGSSIEGSDIYITHSPCIHCLMQCGQCSLGRSGGWGIMNLRLPSRRPPNRPRPPGRRRTRARCRRRPRGGPSSSAGSRPSLPSLWKRRW